MYVYVYAWCRWGAILSNGHLVRVMQLQQEYICNQCEGGVIVRPVPGADGNMRLRAECCECKSRVFMSKWALERAQMDWHAITMHLPQELREIAEQHWARPPGPSVSFDQAVEDLYGVRPSKMEGHHE